MTNIWVKDAVCERRHKELASRLPDFPWHRVCNALSILKKHVKTLGSLGCCALGGACRSIQMGHFQESLKYHPSFFGHSPAIFCHTFFSHPSLSPSARKLRELQQNVIQREHIRRLRGPAGGGQQKTGGGGRVEVPPGGGSGGFGENLGKSWGV